MAKKKESSFWDWFIGSCCGDRDQGKAYTETEGSKEVEESKETETPETKEIIESGGWLSLTSCGSRGKESYVAQKEPLYLHAKSFAHEIENPLTLFGTDGLEEVEIR